MTEMKKKVIQH